MTSPFPSRGYTDDELAKAEAMWCDLRVDTRAIVQLLRLRNRKELYSLREWRRWPTRNTRGEGRPRLVFSYTAEEAHEAEVRWYEGASVKELLRLLHLANRAQLYTVRDREGWRKRRVPWGRRPRVPRTPTNRTPKDKADFRWRGKPAVKPPPDAAALAHSCPTCGFRVAPGIEGSVRLENGLYHAVCAARMAA